MVINDRTVSQLHAGGGGEYLASRCSIYSSLSGIKFLDHVVVLTIVFSCIGMIYNYRL